MQLMQRPVGVSSVAILFFLVAAYLAAAGGLMLAWPGSISMAAGAPLLGGLETAGPYMFLLMGGVAALIGWGLFWMQNWARRAAIIVAFAGFVLLIPAVSAAAVDLRWSLVWSGLGIIVRMVVVWYLWPTQLAEQFSRLRRGGQTPN